MKKIKIFYYIALSLITIGALVGGTFLGFSSSSFYYLFTASLLLIAPFVSLLFILFIEIKKIEFTRTQYLEAYLVILMIAGSLLLWLYSKLELNLNIIYWYVFSLLLFIITTVVFVIIAKKHKNDPKNGPKFIANR